MNNCNKLNRQENILSWLKAMGLTRNEIEGNTPNVLQKMRLIVNYIEQNWKCTKILYNEFKMNEPDCNA